MNKALAPSPAIASAAGSPLIRRRTAGAATATATATATTRRYSDPGPAHPGNGAAPQQDEVEVEEEEEEEEEEPSTESRHKVAGEHNGKSEGAQGSGVAAVPTAAAATAEDCGKSPGGVASLVADYSDSDSSSAE